MKKEEAKLIINQYDDYLYKNSFGSCRPRERNINVEDAMNGLKEILKMELLFDSLLLQEKINKQED